MIYYTNANAHACILLVYIVYKHNDMYVCIYNTSIRMHMYHKCVLYILCVYVYLNISLTASAALLCMKPMYACTTSRPYSDTNSCISWAPCICKVYMLVAYKIQFVYIKVSMYILEAYAYRQI